jgi:23S rRNA m2A2503 methyltransferase
MGEFVKNNKINLFDITFSEIEKLVKEIGLPVFRAQQLGNWLYKNLVFNLEAMSNFSQELRDTVDKNFYFYLPQIEHVAHSELDNSYKFLLKTSDDRLIESILMVEPGRTTVCVSCMIGCPMGCKFCATGTEVGFVRKLSTAEIIGQVLMILRYAKENGIADRVTNVVFMGMGEPFANLDAVERAIFILLDPKLLGMSPAKISVSTACPGNNIAAFINKTSVRLAVSLHFPTNELRSAYMPINKKFNIEEIIKELKKVKLKKRDYILIEYIMLGGINDSLLHAKQLLGVVGNLKVKINLIPYNPTEGFEAKVSAQAAINDFVRYLQGKNVFVSVRKSRGIDIDGGCGQFALKKG